MMQCLYVVYFACSLIGSMIQCRFKSMPIGPEFYGDLVYKLKQIMGRTDFSDQC